MMNNLDTAMLHHLPDRSHLERQVIITSDGLFLGRLNVSGAGGGSGSVEWLA